MNACSMYMDTATEHGYTIPCTSSAALVGKCIQEHSPLWKVLVDRNVRATGVLQSADGLS
eukprot:361871-Chlamydomonas_euryale.AAC.15